ncbi:MAG: tetratricopeptide repeat protein, partial [Acidobacteriota bacterium]
MSCRCWSAWLVSPVLALQVAWLAPFAGASPLLAKESVSTILLSVGRSYEGTLAGGEERTFRADLLAGKIWRVAVDQQGIDLQVTLEPPGGASAVTIDNPLGRFGNEVLVTQPTISGRHLVRLRAVWPQAVQGGYRIEVRSREGDGEHESLRWQAEQILSDAGASYALGTAAARRESVEMYRKVLDLWRRLGDRRGQALALSAIGMVARRLGEPRLAVEPLRQALDLWRAVEDQHRTAMTLNDLGLSHLELGERTVAGDLLAESATLHSATDDLFGEGVARNNLCLLMLSTGEPASAGSCFRRVIELFAAAGERQAEALARNGLAGVYDELGEPASALAELEHAYRLVQELDDLRGQAKLLANQAALYRRLGEPRSALTAYDRALPVLRQLDDRRWLGRTLNNLGFSYLDLGEPRRARSLFEDALALRLEVGDRIGEAVTRNNLGRADRQLGAPAAAVEAHRAALALLSELGQQDRQATTHGLLGHALLDRGEPLEALASFERAHELLGATGKPRRRGRILIDQAWALLALEEVDTALAQLQEALPLFRSLDDMAGEALALVAVGRARLAQGQLEAAQMAAETALARIESLRQRVGGSQLRAVFVDSRHDAYELAVEILMARHRVDPAAGYARQALVVADRSRARELRHRLAVGGSPLGVDPDLRRKRETHRRQLRAQVARRQALLEERRSPEAAEAGRRIEAALNALDAVEGEIETRRPGFTDLARGRPLDWSRVQMALGDATVLQYSLGAERSYLWVLTAQAFEVFELPPGDRLERMTRDAFAQLRTVTAGATRRRGLRDVAGLLLAPAAHRLTGGPLLIVPDGALHYLPFAALPSPADGRPLAVHHEITYLPSAALLSVPRSKAPPGRPAVAVLADPVISRSDPRLDDVSSVTARTGGDEPS